MMRVILHGGTHKTGTKTLQHCLFANRKALADAGVAYPPLNAPAEFNYLAQAFTGVGVLHRGYPITPDQAVATVEHAARSIGNSGTVIVSAEDLSACCLGMRLWQGLDRPDFRDLQRDYLAKIAGAFKRFDIIPVLMFRRGDEFAESLYGTLVRSNNFTGSFESFLAYANPLFEYEAQRTMFATVFGGVEILSFHGPNLVDRFLSAAGIDFRPEQAPIKNISTDARFICWLNARYTARKPTRSEVNRRRRFLRSDAVRGLFPDFGEANFWRSETERAAFHERCAQGLPKLEFPPPRAARGPDARVDNNTIRRISECYNAWKQVERR
jgi:hypothetical protein